MRWTRWRCTRGDRRAAEAVSDQSAPDERWYCVRQNRVVLASVAGAKLCVGEGTRPGSTFAAIREATEARRIRLRGERGISRQTIAQGRPGCPGFTCGHSPCAFLYKLSAQGATGPSRHSAFHALSSVKRGHEISYNSGASRRESALSYLSRPTEYFPRLPRLPIQARKLSGIKNASGEQFDHQGQGLHCWNL